MNLVIKNVHQQRRDWIKQKGHETCPERESCLETNQDSNDEADNDDDHYFS